MLALNIQWIMFVCLWFPIGVALLVILAVVLVLIFGSAKCRVCGSKAVRPAKPRGQMLPTDESAKVTYLVCEECGAAFTYSHRWTQLSEAEKNDLIFDDGPPAE